MPSSKSFFSSPILRVATSQSSLSYRKMGSGPALLFIHGWPLNSATYRDVADSLSGHYTCYLLDLPGAGASPCYANWDNPVLQHTKTVIEFIEAVGLPQVALIGHDSGGAIARFVAAQLGNRITALVLSNTELTDHVVKIVKRYAKFTRLPGSIFFLRALFSSARFRKSSYGFGGCFSDRNHIDGDFHQLFMEPLLSDFSRFKATMAMLSKVDFDELANFRPVHAKIHVPTRFVWGAKDRFFPIEAARKMASEFSAFDTLVEVPDGKLFFHEEFPQVFTDAAASFLDSVVPRY